MDGGDGERARDVGGADGWSIWRESEGCTRTWSFEQNQALLHTHTLTHTNMQVKYIHTEQGTHTLTDKNCTLILTTHTRGSGNCSAL